MTYNRVEVGIAHIRCIDYIETVISKTKFLVPMPEKPASININHKLIACGGWVIQDMALLNRYTNPDVILQKFLDGKI